MEIKISKFQKTNKLDFYLVLILVMGAFFRLYKINYQSLWLDEIFTLNIANPDNSFSQVVSQVNISEGFPYLYFLLMNTIFKLFGDDVIIARLPSAIFGIVSIFFMFKLAKELLNKHAGYIAAVLLAINEYSIYYSQEARPYAFYLFSLIVSYYLLIKYIKTRTIKNAVLYGVGLGLLLNSNFFATINVLAQGMILMATLFFVEKTEKKQCIKETLIIIGLAFLFFLPNSYKFYTLTKLTSTGWIPAPTNDGLTVILKEFLSNSEILNFLYLPLFFYFLIVCFKEENSIDLQDIITQKKSLFYIIVLSWIFLVVFVVVLKSYTGSSLYVSRYFSSVLPAVLLIFAFSLFYIKNKIAKISFFFVLICFTLVNTLIVRKYYSTPIKSQFREAANFTILNNENNEAVVSDLGWYFPYFFKKANSKTSIIDKNIDAYISEKQTDTTKLKSFWFISAHGSKFNPSESTQAFLEKHYTITHSFDGFDAWVKHFEKNTGEYQEYDLSKYPNLGTQNGDKIKSWVDSFEKIDTNYSIIGWGYLEGQNADNSQLSILLLNNKKVYKINCGQVIRQDITNSVKTGYNLDNSGFKVNVKSNNLSKGTYKVGLLIKNPITGKEGIVLTDKQIVAE